MPDVEILDLHSPYPDVVIDRLRRAVVEALDGLQQQIDRINNAFLLLSVTADFSQATKNVVTSGQTAIAQMQTTAGGLGQQVAAVNTRAEAAQIAAETAQADADLLQQQMTDVLNRLVALESPAPAPTEPEA